MAQLAEPMPLPAEPGAAGPAGRASAPALGNNTDFATIFSGAPQLPEGFTQIEGYAVPQVTDEGALQSWEAINWLSLAHARHLCEQAGSYHRLMACGSQIRHNCRLVEVFQSPDAGRGKIKGICRCGQTICCPVCAPRVSGFRAEEVADGYRHAVGMGWDVYLVTLTAPHHRESTLLDEAMWWRDMWRWAFSEGMSARAVKTDWLGYITATEMTHGGASGWHYHRHLLLFVKPDMGELAVCMMRARWLAAIRRGHRDNGGIEKHAFNAKRCDDKIMAYYCSKVGAELNATTTKDSATPLSILRDAALDGKAAPLWLEALTVCSSMKISSCRWSRGLRASLHMPAEREDDEIAEDALQVGDVFLGYVTPDQWRRLVFERRDYAFMQAVQGGFDAANQFLEDAGLGALLMSKETFKIETRNKQ